MGASPMQVEPHYCFYEKQYDRAISGIGHYGEVGWMAWGQIRGGSGSLPCFARTGLPYEQYTDASRLDSKFPFGDRVRQG